MQGMIRCGVLAGCLIACHTSDPAGPDGGSADGQVGASGMHVVWTTEPAAWPAAISDGIQLDSVTFYFDNLKVIGDAGPGDNRTTANAFQLHWDAMAMPATIDFPDAPTGVYSKVTFQMDGHLVEASYKLRGHTTLNGVSVPFAIEDREALSLSLPCNRTLAPGGSVTIGVVAKFSDALQSIDWSTLRDDNGTLELETTDAQMTTFRDKFTASFSIEDSGPN